MNKKILIVLVAAGLAFLLVPWLIPVLAAQSQRASENRVAPAAPRVADSPKQAPLPVSSKETLEGVTKENELLRSIVVRQHEDQEKRAAATELLKDELARLAVQSALLDRQLQILAGATVQLSDEELALFKDSPTPIVNSTPQPTVNSAPDAAIVKADPMSVDQSSVGPIPESASSPSPGGMASTVPAQFPPLADTAFKPPVAAASMPLARAAKEDFDKGRYPEAAKSYEKLLIQEPKNPYLLASQGLVLLRQGKAKEAEAILRKATAISPKDAFSQATLGIVYFKMQRYDEAIAALTQAIQLDPKNATAHNYLGITSSQKGWPEAAVDEVQKAIALNPNYAEAHFNMAVIYATSQPPSKDRAEEHYKIATSLGTPPDPALEKLIKTER